jgi:Fe-S cluster assembly iron-binding protein IscA
LLEISPSAAEVIRQMVDTLDAVAGVRVAMGPSESTNGTAPQLKVTIAPAAGPMEDDETIDEDGIAVFVDPDIAPLLDDKLLDLEPAGPERMQFRLTEQSEP